MKKIIMFLCVCIGCAACGHPDPSMIMDLDDYYQRYPKARDRKFHRRSNYQFHIKKHQNKYLKRL